MAETGHTTLIPRIINHGYSAKLALTRSVLSTDLDAAKSASECGFGETARGRGFGRVNMIRME